jgi:hypothetical protein
MKGAAYLAIKAKYAEESPVFHDDSLKGEGVEDSILSVDFEPIYETLEVNEGHRKTDLSRIQEALFDIYESFRDTDSQLELKAEKTDVEFKQNQLLALTAKLYKIKFR